MNSIPLKAEFIKNMQLQLGNEADDFFQTLETKSPVSIRTNPSKPLNPNNPLLNNSINKVPWCLEGYYLSERPRFGSDPFFHAGCYYVQEAGSMFTGEVFRKLKEKIKKTQGQAGVKVLDLCAAPGGKSTNLLSLLGEEDLLVSNEIIPARNKILQYNIIKWGYPNVIVSRNEAKDFSSLEGYFDVIVIDAPCSGEGLFRREPEARKEWSLQGVKGCSSRQKDILKNVMPALKENGLIIYSTCTYEKAENDDIIEYCCNELNCESVSIDSNPEGIVKTKYGLQFYPHRMKAEGFYISLLKKKRNSQFDSFDADKKIAAPPLPSASAGFLKHPEKFNLIETIHSNIAFPKNLMSDYEFLSRSLNIFYSGIDLGEIKKEVWIPSPSLPLSIHFNDANSIALNNIDVLKYLKGESIFSSSPIKGWCSVNYEGHYLGWLKMLENRSNNYYPKGWRIGAQF